MSTTERPAPMVPAECTMGGNDWFPLSHRKLRKSKWWRRASDLARARNVMLWGEAYDATPAGSLPDDDDDLAEAAGFGMDVEAFIAVKAEIMAPWVLCSDGRWYHPTVCEVVLETWEKQSAKRRADAERKARSRARIRGGPEGVTADEENVTRDADASHTGNHHTDRQTERTEKTETPPLPPTGGGDDEVKPKRRQPQRPIPDGFPTEEVIAEEQQKAREAGANIDVRIEAEKFRAWALSKDARYADWRATFRNWMLKRVADAPKNLLGRPRQEAKLANPDDEWRQRIQRWIRSEFWNEYDWGRKPTHPNTDVPKHILEEFQIEQRQLRVVGGGEG